ncbi:MAG: hypothetical protein WEB62_05110 [Bacteroidota bacterium]
MPAVSFEKEYVSLDLLPGSNLRQAALRSGIHLYAPLWRVLHANIDLGLLKFPCAGDVVEIEGKGVNARTEDEELLIAGRYLIKRKVTANLRLACAVTVTGDIKVKTLPARELDRVETKRAIQYAAVISAFLLGMGVIMVMIALDLVQKI